MIKKKVFKTTNQFGVAEYHEYMNMDGVIAVGLRIAAEQPENQRAQALVSWLKELGRKPTHEEFKSWVEGYGVRLHEVKAEDFEN